MAGMFGTESIKVLRLIPHLGSLWRTNLGYKATEVLSGTLFNSTLLVKQGVSNRLDNCGSNPTSR